MSRLALALNNINETLRGLYGSGGIHGDTKHSKAWVDYGYPSTISFDQHYNMYRRFGIAKAGIDATINQCWSRKPEILQGSDDTDAENREDVTPWESKLDLIFKKHKLFNSLRMVDAKQAVYQYGAFIVQVKGIGDQVDWAKPLDNIRPEQIVKFMSVYQNQLKADTFDEDKTSIRYGEPLTYTFQESGIKDNQQTEGRNRSQTVHYSRVIVFAEGAAPGSIYGTPRNEAGFNDLLTLEKIIGAGGEGLWKNSSMKTVYNNTDKDAVQMSQEELDATDSAITDFVENMDKHLMVNGLTPNVISANLPPPQEFFNNALASYSASVQTPNKILIGAQTGRLAADEDGKFWLSTCQSRCENWCGVMVESVVEWLIEHSALEQVEYMVTWSDLIAPSDDDKLTLAGKMADVNSKMFAVTGVVFTDIEMRAIVGYKPLDESDLPDMPDDKEDDDLPEGDQEDDEQDEPEED